MQNRPMTEDERLKADRLPKPYPDREAYHAHLRAAMQQGGEYAAEAVAYQASTPTAEPEKAAGVERELSWRDYRIRILEAECERAEAENAKLKALLEQADKVISDLLDLVNALTSPSYDNATLCAARQFVEARNHG